MSASRTRTAEWGRTSDGGMGCAPSAATAAATSPRVSLADDRKTAEATATDGGMRGAAEATAADAGRSYTGAIDSAAGQATRVNGDVPLTKASLLALFMHERLNGPRMHVI